MTRGATPRPRLLPEPPRWILGPAPDPGRVRRLADELDLPEPLCALLVSRGFDTPEDAKTHLRPRLDHLLPPEELQDGAVAVDRVMRAIDEGETILVHGDYDVDGVAAATLLTTVLRSLGGRVEPFVPHRLRDGYDFGPAGLAAARKAGASLIVTADCGVVAHDTVRAASGAGIDVVITDHHTPGATLPDAVAVVNPNRADCRFAGKELSGAGVAFKLCTLLARSADLPFDELVPHLDLVALATVADLVPLRGENRTLVRYGLRALSRSAKPGLQALLDVCGLGGKEITAGQVGFVIAPRINAVGRMGDAGDALRLLLSEDPEEARALARHLNEINGRRQEEDRRTLDEALAMLEEGFRPERDFGVVLASDGWHPGVIGIVASRVVERIHRPTVLVALDGERGRGSARSIPGFHLFEALAECQDRFERFGGHRQAAGMDIRRRQVDAFRADFNRVAQRRLSEWELRPTRRADLESGLQGLDLRTADLLQYLGPHGIGNPRPVFLVRGAEVRGQPRVVGRNHLKLQLATGSDAVDAIGFGLADRRGGEVGAGLEVDALFQLEANEYRGNRTLQARLVDVRPAGAESITVETGAPTAHTASDTAESGAESGEGGRPERAAEVGGAVALPATD